MSEVITLLLVPSRRVARDVPKDHHDGDTQRKEERLGTLKVSVMLTKPYRLSRKYFAVESLCLLALKRAFFLSGGSVTLQ